MMFVSAVFLVVVLILLSQVTRQLFVIALRELERRRWSPTRERLRQFSKAVERPPAGQ